MTQVYGEELAKQIRESIARTRKVMEDRDRRIAKWETDEDDCFLSIRFDEEDIRKCQMQLDILNGDGCHDFNVVVDENGKVVRTHWFKNQWGRYSIVGNGVFASSMKALLKKTGWHEETRRYPVWVKFVANGNKHNYRTNLISC